MQLRTLLEKLIASNPLSIDKMKQVMHGWLQNTIDPVQLAAFLALMRKELTEFYNHNQFYHAGACVHLCYIAAKS